MAAWLSSLDWRAITVAWLTEFGLMCLVIILYFSVLAAAILLGCSPDLENPPPVLIAVVNVAGFTPSLASAVFLCRRVENERSHSIAYALVSATVGYLLLAFADHRDDPATTTDWLIPLLQAALIVGIGHAFAKRDNLLASH